jgi:hypothetical protein
MLLPDTLVTVLRGNIYLSCQLCDTCFHGIDSVALLARDGDVLVVPLIRSSPGGLLLKVRNARGDRVIQAQEFLRGLGLREDFSERRYPVRWRSDVAALEIVSVNKVCN